MKSQVDTRHDLIFLYLLLGWGGISHLFKPGLGSAVRGRCRFIAISVAGLFQD